MRSVLLRRVGVHRHPGSPLIHPVTGHPADVQRRDLGVRHLRPVRGMDPGVGAGPLLGPGLGPVAPGLAVAVRAVHGVRVEGPPQPRDLPGGQEVLGVVLAQPRLEGAVAVPQELLHRRALLLAVVELGSGLRDLHVDVVVVHARHLGLGHRETHGLPKPK